MIIEQNSIFYTLGLYWLSILFLFYFLLGLSYDTVLESLDNEVNQLFAYLFHLPLGFFSHHSPPHFTRIGSSELSSLGYLAGSHWPFYTR